MKEDPIPFDEEDANIIALNFIDHPDQEKAMLASSVIGLWRRISKAAEDMEDFKARVRSLERKSYDGEDA